MQNPTDEREPKVGDVVMLKSGSSRMVVGSIRDQQAGCLYWTESRVVREELPLAVLTVMPVLSGA